MCIMKFNWNKRTLASSRELWLSFWCEVQYNSLYSIQEFLRLVAPRKHLLLLNPWSFQWEKVQYVVVEWEMVLDSYNPVPGVMEGVPSSRDYNGGFASKLMNFGTWRLEFMEMAIHWEA
ncbi:uncharacterized protein [Arachis hypogaea]|uniref:uncharacterized protein isoform X2 n=1 Tax=Arachis hypogaea TaxID=3818 RepID=UPI003B20FC0C